VTPTDWLRTLSEMLGVSAIILLASRSPRIKSIVPLGFRYPFRDGPVALSLFVLLFVFAFQVYRWPALLDLIPVELETLYGQTFLRAGLALAALLIILLALILRGQPLWSASWQKTNLRMSIYAGVAAGFLTLFLRNRFMTVLGGVSPEAGRGLLVLLVMCLAEETVFRGYIQPRLVSWWGPRWGLVGAVAAYVLWQLPGRLWVLPFAGIWPVLVIALVQGALLAWMRQKTGHVIGGILYRTLSAWLAFL